MSVKPVNGECPEGYRWNPIKKECEKIPSRTGNCPEGYVWDYDSQSCVENTPEYREKGLLFTLRFMESKGFSKEDIELMAKSKNLYTEKIKEFVDGLKGVGEKSVEEDNIEDAPIQTTPPTTTKTTEVKQPTTIEPPAPAKQLTEDEKKEQEKKLQLRNQRLSEYSKEIEALKNDPQISQSSRFDGILYRKQKELQDKLNSEFPPEQLGIGSNDFMDSFRSNQPTVNSTPASIPPSAQQQTPPAQPVIPPTNSQGQVEFMQQQAQQMPVPNEVSSMSVKPVNGECPDGYVYDSNSKSCIPTSYKYVSSNLGEPKWSSQQSDGDYISELVKIGVSEADAQKRLQEKKKIQADARSKVFAKGGSDAVALLDLVNSGADLTKHQDLIEKVTKTTGISKSFPDNEDVFGFISIADNVSRVSNPEYYKKKEDEKQLQESQQIPEKRKKFEQELRSAGADQEEIDYELKRFDSGNKGVGYAEYKAQQQQTPPAQPVIPPANPQGQVEFMQQQAQQMPVPNEVSSRTQLPPVAVGMPEAEQQVGMQEEMPQDNGSIFQRLRNLFSGKSPQPPQPNVAPQQPNNEIDANIARMGAIATNAEPGVYTNPNVINAQNQAGTSISGLPSFNQSGLTGDETTGAPTGTIGTTSTANVNTGALPKEVVKPAQPTGTQPTGQVAGQVAGQVSGQVTGQTGTQTGGGTPTPPFATPGIVGGGGGFMGSEYVRAMPGQVFTTVDEKGVKSKSIQDLIEIGGTGFDDDVLARKLRRQAAMPDLKNEDYYPNEPFSESRTAWNDPIFSGAGAQFPMAAYDAQRKARAQAELDEAKQNVMQIKIPEIKTGAYYNAVKSGFTQQVTDIVNDAVARGGNYAKAKRILDQEGTLAQAQSEWQGVAKMIDEKADVATEYLKNARENPKDLYFPFEGVTAATNFMNGMNEFANGRITPAQLLELDKRMVSADKWEKFKQDNMAKLKPTDYIPTPEQLKNITPEDREAFKAVKLDLGDKAPDFNTWLFTQKYTEAALPQVMEGIVQPFFDQNKTAAEQLVLPGESLDAAKKRVANGIAALFGRQYDQGTVTQNQKSVTNNNLTINSDKPGETYYQNLNDRSASIISGTQEIYKTLNTQNATGQQRATLAKKGFRDMFRAISNKGEVTPNYIGYEPVNVATQKITQTPMLYSEYKKYDSKTRKFVPMTANDWGLTTTEGNPDTNRYSNSRPEGTPTISKMEIVLLNPDGSTTPWDGNNIATGAELYVVMENTVDISKPSQSFVSGEKVPSNTKKAYTMAPLSQMGKTLDDIFQKLSNNENEAGKNNPIQFGK